MRVVHYAQAAAGGLPLARDERERRRLLRALTETAGEQLLLFALVDDQLHTVLSHQRLGLLVRGLREMLARLRPGLQLEAPHLRSVRSHEHLLGLVEYILGQSRDTLGGVHPVLQGGTCLQDLIGARLLPGFRAGAIAAELPRLSQRELLARVGLPPLRPLSATDEQLRRAGLPRLVDLAAAILCVAPELDPADPRVAELRALMARLAVARLGFTAREVADRLGLAPDAILRLAAGPAGQDEARFELALRRRLTLEEWALSQRPA